MSWPQWDVHTFRFHSVRLLIFQVQRMSHRDLLVNGSSPAPNAHELPHSKFENVSVFMNVMGEARLWCFHSKTRSESASCSRSGGAMLESNTVSQQ